MRGRPPRAAGSDPIVPEGFCACPVDIAFSVFGRKWALHLIRNMLRGQRHFNQFLQGIEGINPRVLSARLKELEQEHVIVKRVTRSTPVVVEYQLTDKGLAALPILRQMVTWSVRWAPDRLFTTGHAPSEIEHVVEEWQEVLVRHGPDETTMTTRARRRVHPADDSGAIDG